MPPGGELALIEAIAGRLSARRQDVIVGVGDDAAVLRAAPVCITSVDAVVEGVHFQLGEGRSSHADVGFKALGSALSDIAAMGARQGEAYIVLGLSPATTHTQALAVIDGALELAQATGVSLLGGDVVTAQALFVCVTVVGWAQLQDPIVYRSGARPGDLVGVTGELGLAGAGLAHMQGSVELSAANAAKALERSLRPLPRLLEGRALAQAGASALVDISDGLAADAGHIGRASGVSLEIDLGSLPTPPAVREAARQLKAPPWQLAASAGEDYELCACVPASRRSAAERALRDAGGTSITWIGEVAGPAQRGPGAAFTIDGRQVRLAGFEHRWQEAPGPRRQRR